MVLLAFVLAAAPAGAATWNGSGTSLGWNGSPYGGGSSWRSTPDYGTPGYAAGGGLRTSDMRSIGGHDRHSSKGSGVESWAPAAGRGDSRGVAPGRSGLGWDFENGSESSDEPRQRVARPKPSKSPKPSVPPAPPPNPIPLPASIWLLLGGAGLLAWKGRKTV